MYLARLHRLPWRMICTMAGAKRTTLWGWLAASFDRIARRLNEGIVMGAEKGLNVANKKR